MTDFKDKIVLITGGSRGLGRSMALGFARKGAHIAIVSRKLEVCEQVTEELFDKVVGVNLKGPFRLSANVGKRMVEEGSGCIINISSTASVNPSPNSEPYGASKAGLNAITRSFASALGPKVRVNCIIAGPFLTDISKAWDMDAFKKRAANSIPMKRGGQPDEIVGAALYLASDAASFTTAALLSVDGGSH